MKKYNGKIFIYENKNKVTYSDELVIVDLSLEEIIKLLEKLKKEEKNIFTCQFYIA